MGKVTQMVTRGQGTYQTGDTQGRAHITHVTHWRLDTHSGDTSRGKRGEGGGGRDRGRQKLVTHGKGHSV